MQWSYRTQWYVPSVPFTRKYQYARRSLRACTPTNYLLGGHTKGGSYRSFLSNARKLGDSEAIKIARLEYDCMKAVHAFAREHSIECDSRELDTVDVVYDQGQWDEAVKSIRYMLSKMKANEPASRYKLWTAEEASEKFLTHGAVGAISYAAGSLSAYKFVVGMLRLALENGLNLQTNTAVTSVTRISLEGRKDRWSIQTPRGPICADQVVMATNGYTAHIWPKLQGVIVPLRGHVSAHRPGSEMPKAGLPTTYSFIYKEGYEYMIPRPPGSEFAGDIVIGGGLVKTSQEGLYEYGCTDDTSLDLETITYLRETTPQYFGKNWGRDSDEGRIRKEWSGIMGYSPDGFPLVGPLPDEDNLYISASFQGHGMVLCFLCAKALTEMMIDGDEKELDSWFPRAFRVTKARFGQKFKRKLHTVLTQNSKVCGPAEI